MAYKQSPGRGNQSKTGRGIPTTFKQNVKSPVKQMETIKKIGSAISRANEAGKKAYDESIRGASYFGGTGRKDTYEKNPIEYVKGFAKDIVSDSNAKTNEKKKPAPAQMKKSPVKQMETIKKIYNKGKEIVSKVGDKISSANEAGQKSYDESIRGASYFGGTGRKDTYEKNPIEYVKGFVKNIVSDDNPKTNEKKKSPAKQMNKKAVTKMSKKTPAKMKSC